MSRCTRLSSSRYRMNFAGALFHVFVLVIAGVSASFGQSLSWVSISGVPGCVTVREGAEGKLFAASDGSVGFNGVLYSSNDDGQSWYPTTINYGWIFEVVTNGGHVIVTRYLSGGRFPYQAFLSDDNGLTWRGIMSSDIFFNPFSGFMYSDSGRIYTIAGNQTAQLMRLNGQRWDPIGTTFPAVVFSGNNPTGLTPAVMDHEGRIYVGTLANGIYMSTNTGTTWKGSLPGLNVTAVGVGTPDQIAVGTSPNAARNGGIFFSSDTGKNWTFLGLADEQIRSVHISADGALFATTNTGVYRYGGTPNVWDDLSPSKEAFGAIEVNGSHAYFAAAIAKGIFRSTDNGVSWERSGIPREDIGSLLATDQGSVMAGSLGNRVFVTNNNGGTWGQTFPGTMCDNVYALLESPPYTLAGTDCGVYSSTDMGKSWMPVSQSQFTGGAFALAKDHQGRVFAGTNFGVYMSTDNGTTWNTFGLGSFKVTGLGVNSADRLYALAGTGGVQTTPGDAMAWTSLGLAVTGLQTIAVNPADQIFVGADGGIYKSTDGGATWPFTPMTNAFVYALAFTDASTIVAATGNGVFASLNGGASWVPRNTGLNQPVILSLGVDENGYVYAGALHGGVYKSAQILLDVKEPRSVPAAFSLVQNYPNPFNPVTTIEYDIASPARTTLEVYNVMGEKVATLVDEFILPGAHRVQWDASGLPSAIYYGRLRSGAHTAISKMLLLR